MPITDVTVRNAKPKEKPYKLSDEKGLYLLVRGSGKYFRLDYRFAGKRKTLALGVYPDVSLAEAREQRDVSRAFDRLLQHPLVSSTHPGHSSRDDLSAVGHKPFEHSLVFIVNCAGLLVAEPADLD